MKQNAAWWLGCLAAAAAAGAQAIPPTAPTLPAHPSAIAAPPPAKTVIPTHRARVEFAGKTLEIKADNSSLNQILRDVAHATGMKITGGVPEERVYGTYGPAETSTVLTTLLGGTGSNMLLIVDSHNLPTELVLTPRQGGATPPNPSAGRDERDEHDDDNPDTPPQLSQHIQRPAPPPPPPTATVQAEPVAPTTTPETTPSATTTDQSPNGVKTPQQIYDQLLKLQQQQPKPPGATSPP